MSLTKYGGAGYSPWAALAYNAATNKRFHKFALGAGRSALRLGRAGLNRYKGKMNVSKLASKIMNRPRGPSRATVASGSASHGGTQRFRSSRGRRSWKRKGRGTRRYGGKRRRRGGQNKGYNYLLKMVTTPQITKITRADSFGGLGSGLRTWAAILLNSKNNLQDMWDRRPAVFFNNNEANPAVAATQTSYGTSHKCHLTSFKNKLILQNRSNWDMELKVYECMVRRDKGRTLSGSASGWITNLFDISDSNVVNKGRFQPAYAGGLDLLTTVWQNPGYTPYMSNTFCEALRIVKTSVFKIGMNDYVTYYANCNGKRFGVGDLGTNLDQAGFPEVIGGWTKVLLFSWVGGPVDNEQVGGASRQSKAICDLFVQIDIMEKFYFEPRANRLYNVASSNATTVQLGYDTTNNYSTVPNAAFVVPATSVSQSIATDDTPNLHP